MKKQFRNFEDARKIVRNLRLKIQAEYREWWRINKPDDLPGNPPGVYKNKGWTSWGDFLGTGFIAPQLRKYKSFEKARTIVKKLGLKTLAEYRTWWRINKPDDLPGDPQQVYKKQETWTSWGDFLGTGYVAPQLRKYKSFEKARTIVKKLGLKTLVEYRKWWKINKPDDLPGNPPTVYKNKGWSSWGDFLGTGFVGSIPKSKLYKSFEESRKLVKKLGLKTGNEYKKWWKKNKPSDLPANPYQTYKNKGWISFGDFLGSDSIAPSLRQFKSFEESRKYIQTLKLSGKEEYAKWAHSSKRPIDIPSSPSKTYKKEWKGWGDWLDTGTISTIEQSKETLPWNIAKPLYQKIARENNLKTQIEWQEYAKTHDLPKGLPKNPDRSYSKQVVIQKKKERTLRYNQNLNS